MSVQQSMAARSLNPRPRFVQLEGKLRNKPLARWVCTRGNGSTRGNKKVEPGSSLGVCIQRGGSSTGSRGATSML